MRGRNTRFLVLVRDEREATEDEKARGTGAKNAVESIWNLENVRGSLMSRGVEWVDLCLEKTQIRFTYLKYDRLSYDLK